MPDQDGLRFLFDIQDKLTAKLAKIEAKSKASAEKINSAFTKASNAQQALAAKVIHTSKLRGIAVENATAKATAARTKETTQGKILAQRLASAQATEARRAENFRIAAGKRTATALAKSERAIANSNLKTNRTFKAFSTATFAGMVSAAGAIALARKAWTSLTGLIKSSFSLWGEQEQSVVAMTTALKAQGTYTPALAKSYQDLASELQGLSTDGDEALLKMQALLIQVGDVGPDQMREALTAAQDLATGLDVDLKTAALLVGKAFAGDTATLKRYGIVLDQTELKQKGVAVVLDAIQAKFGGQAAAKAKTFAGLIEQLGNKWGDLKEKIGQWLTQSSGLLTPMLGKINKAVGWMNDNFDDLKPILAAVVTLLGVGLVGGLAAAAVAVWAMVPAITAMTGGLNLIVPIIALVAAAGVGAWVKWGGQIKSFLSGTWEKMKAGLLAFKGWIVDAFKGVKAKLDTVIGFFSNMNDKVVGFTKDVNEGVKLWMVTKLGKLFKKVDKAVEKVTDFFGDMKDKIVDFAKDVYEGIKKWMSDKPKSLYRKIKRAVEKVTDFFDDMKDKIVGHSKAVHTGIKLWMLTKIVAVYSSIKAKVDAVTGYYSDMKATILGIVEAVYTGVKLWMSDKLGAIFDGIKAKVDAVTGFFGDMKDKIVGNSIVPEMVDLVVGEFGRMGTGMVDETGTAATGVVTNLESIGDGIDDLDAKVDKSTTASKFTSQWNTAMGTLTANISKSITDIWSGEGSPLKKLGNAFLEFGKGALSAVTAVLLTPLLNAVTDIATQIGTKLFSSITSAVTGALTSALGGAAGGAASGAASAGVGGVLGTILGSGGIVGGLISGGISAIGSIIGGIIASGKSKAIEENTRFSAIDLHGIRHGLATGEFFMQDWHIIAAIHHVNDTLVATLWSIRYQLVNFLPPKIATLLKDLKAMVTSSNNGLAELKAIHKNTDGLVESIQSIPKGLTSKDLSLAMANTRRSGPEMFVPSNSGRIEPNGSSGGATVDPRILARAIKDALGDTAVEVDGRRLGRLVTRHQPLAIAELGGRR